MGLAAKAEKVRLKLKELDQLLAKKKISPEKYLDLKADLELQLKEKSVETAKEATKPKILNVVCPNCGSPQKEAPLGDEFSCETCGKLIKVFDAVREAQRLLEKMPELMESVALQQLFIEPTKLKMENALQAGMAADFILNQLKPVIAQNSARYPANPLNSSFSWLLDSHGFRFLTILEETPVPITYNVDEMEDMQSFPRLHFPRVLCTVIPFTAYKETDRIVLQKYDDENFSPWARDEIEEVIEMLDSGTQKKMRQVIAKCLADMAAEKNTTTDKLDEKMVYSAVRDLALEGFAREQDPYRAGGPFQNLAYMNWVNKVVGRMNSAPKGKRPIIYPWNDSKKLEKRASSCFAAVRPLNELANLFAVLSTYTPNLEVSMFMGLLRDSISKKESVMIDEVVESKFAPRSRNPAVRVGEEERKRLCDEDDAIREKEGNFFGFFPATCWANFYKGLASYAQGYGQMLLLNKERIEKKIEPTSQLPPSAYEFTRNFEDAAAAFERAAQKSDEKRAPYLNFYAQVCKGIASMLRGKIGGNKAKKIREEKVGLTKNQIEAQLIALNIGYVGEQATGIQQFYIRDGRSWVNQRVAGLARTIEGPRYLFFTDALLFPGE